MPVKRIASRICGPASGEKAVCCRPAFEEAMNTFELAQRQTQNPGVVVVDVSGELDLTNAHEVEEQLEGLSATNGASLVLDLNKLLFIDSAALHVLFRTARRLGREHFGLVLEPTAAVARTLDIVGIDEVATVAASADALPASLSPG
jgi:anti-anti-sigma factor